MEEGTMACPWCQADPALPMPDLRLQGDGSVGHRILLGNWRRGKQIGEVRTIHHSSPHQPSRRQLGIVCTVQSYILVEAAHANATP